MANDPMPRWLREMVDIDFFDSEEGLRQRAQHAERRCELAEDRERVLVAALESICYGPPWPDAIESARIARDACLHVSRMPRSHSN